MKYVIYTLSDGIDSRPTSTKNQKLVSFKKSIKREETAYFTLKDERYFDGFSRSLYITAKSHECEQVLDPAYTPSNAEEDLFEAKQIFMFSVFDKHSNKVCLSTKDATSTVGCNSGLHAGKRSEGKVSLPPCSLTNFVLSLCSNSSYR